MVVLIMNNGTHLLLNLTPNISYSCYVDSLNKLNTGKLTANLTLAKVMRKQHE